MLSWFFPAKFFFAQKNFPFSKYQKSFGGKKINLAKKIFNLAKKVGPLAFQIFFLNKTFRVLYCRLWDKLDSNLLYCFYELAEMPEDQRKWQEEIDEVLLIDSNTRELNYEKNNVYVVPSCIKWNFLNVLWSNFEPHP